jgi:hypothetical protein
MRAYIGEKVGYEATVDSEFTDDSTFTIFFGEESEDLNRDAALTLYLSLREFIAVVDPGELNVPV